MWNSQTTNNNLLGWFSDRYILCGKLCDVWEKSLFVHDNHQFVSFHLRKYFFYRKFENYVVIPRYNDRSCGQIIESWIANLISSSANFVSQMHNLVIFLSNNRIISHSLNKILERERESWVKTICFSNWRMNVVGMSIFGATLCI